MTVECIGLNLREGKKRMEESQQEFCGIMGSIVRVMNKSTNRAKVHQMTQFEKYFFAKCIQLEFRLNGLISLSN